MLGKCFTSEFICPQPSCVFKTNKQTKILLSSSGWTVTYCVALASCVSRPFCLYFPSSGIPPHTCKPHLVLYSARGQTQGFLACQLSTFIPVGLHPYPFLVSPPLPFPFWCMLRIEPRSAQMISMHLANIPSPAFPLFIFIFLQVGP